MALTGTLLADFSAFTAACDKAEVSLTGFEGGAGKVETQLTRVSNSLSGVKIVQEATIAAAAVDKIGGISNLTEKELARVSATAQEAAAKLTGMGQTVPPNIEAIADAGKNVNAVHTDMIGIVGNVAAAFGITYSLGAIVSFIGSLGTAALALRNLSYETQIDTGALQVLTTATKEYGIEGDQLGRAIYQLGRRLAGGDDSVVTGLALMGLSLDDVKGKHGEDLFVTIMRAAGGLHGEIRDTAMADLFGGKLGASLGAASVGFDDTYEKAKRVTHQMSPEAVNAAAEMAVQIDVAEKNFSRLATNLLGPTAAGLNRFIETSQKAGLWATVWARIKDDLAAGLGPLAETNFNALTAAVDAGTGANLRMAVSHGVVKAAVDTRSDAEKFLAVLEANAAVALDATQLANLAHLKDIGQQNAKNAEGIGVNVAQFEKYKAGLEAAKKATEDLAKANAEADAIAMTGFQKRIASLDAVAQASLKAYGFAAQIAALSQLEASERALAKSVYDSLTSEKDRAKVVEDLTARANTLEIEKTAIRLKQAGLVNAGVIEALTVQTAYNKTLGLDAAGAILIQNDALDKLNVRLRQIADMHTTEAATAILVADAERTFTQTLYDEATAADKASAALAAKTTATEKAAKAAADAAAADAARVAALVGKIPSTWSLPIGSGQDLQKMAQDRGGQLAYDDNGNPYVYIPGMNAAPHTGSGPGIHLQLNPSGTGFTPSRDSGGPVTAGQSYVIGLNRQPELFTPGASGFVTPLGAGGGGGGGVVFQPGAIVIQGSVIAEADLIARLKGSLTRTILQAVKVGAV